MWRCTSLRGTVSLRSAASMHSVASLLGAAARLRGSCCLRSTAYDGLWSTACHETLGRRVHSCGVAGSCTAGPERWRCGCWRSLRSVAAACWPDQRCSPQPQAQRRIWNAATMACSATPVGAASATHPGQAQTVGSCLGHRNLALMLDAKHPRRFIVAC